MNFESCKNVFIAKNEEDEIILKPQGKPAVFDFSCDKKQDKHYRLFVTGETGLFYLWRGEVDYPETYHTLTDALCNTETRKAQYSLNVSREKAETFEWRAYKKIMWPPVLSYLALNPVGNNWKVGFWVKAQDLKINPNGKLLMRICVYEKKEGLHVHSTDQPLVKNLEIPVEQGCYDWIKIERELDILEKNTAFVGVWFEGVDYTGNVYIESPFLTSETGYNVLPDFSIAHPGVEKFAWSAENLSKKEWPKFAVCLNGTEIFRGERFERIHRNAEWEIDLPDQILQGENRLEIKLISDYFTPTPYSIKEVRLLEQVGGKVAIVAMPDVAIKDKDFPILIRTQDDNATVILDNEKVYNFSQKGLHVITLDANLVSNKDVVKVECDDQKLTANIPPVLEKIEDDVITGTGDLIYVAQEDADIEEYISWYLSNGLGNLLTIRPTYRWSSTRIVNPKVWEKVKEIMCDYGVKYSHMLDGRETPGFNSNPSIKMLDSENFLGRQRHEDDGKVLYHAVKSLNYGDITAWQVNDMRVRLGQEYPDNSNIGERADINEYTQTCAYTNRNPNQPHDIVAGTEYAVERLRTMRRDSTRHTGPTILFRYFLQAGYDWVGLETTYTTIEPHVAFLRGVTKAFGLKSNGVHNAIQWSSTPHDTVERFRRYRLSLYVPYVQGVKEINTEEGLWRLEEYYSGFHRLTDACVGHRKQQEDFYRYVSTHSRTGEFYTPMALLHGKYDPWKGFCNWDVLGWPCVFHSEAEESWQLLKTFYPLGKPGELLYFHNCPADKPMGYYTGTPNGNIDVMPIEVDSDMLSSYRTLAFVGYNYACKEEFDKLEQYVRLGGKLIMTRAHRTITTWHEDICNRRLSYDDKIALGFTDGAQQFINDTYDGCDIQVCVNALSDCDVLIRTDSGNPLVCKYKLGKGEVVLFNVNAYPANPAIKKLYEKTLNDALIESTQQENVWVSTDENVEFSVYNQKDGAKHVYMLAVDWYRDPDYARQLTTRIGKNEYDIEIPFGIMYKCVVRDNIGVYCLSESGEVLSVLGKTARVQGVGKQSFVILKDGKKSTVEVDFSKSSAMEISIG